MRVAAFMLLLFGAAFCLIGWSFLILVIRVIAGA